jgi:hypothetical protein
MTNGEVQSTDSSLGNFYAVVIINYSKNDRNGKSTVEGREIGRVFTEYKDKLVIIDGEDKKEHEYLIPKSKVDYYDDKKIFLNISYDSLNEFEI